jgi:transposase
LRFLKNLTESFELIRFSKTMTDFDSVNFYAQDESRFGLITKQKRVLTKKGLKPIGKYKHSYQSKWLWGSFSLITGESFCMLTDNVCKDLFVKYLADFSEYNPRELKIILIDNASFHSTKDIELPNNIVLLPIPPYCPELNPAERVWQWMKDKMAMKIYDTLETLEQKIEKLIESLQNQTTISLTSYGFLVDAYNGVFKD